jgi:hypothetical protein
MLRSTELVYFSDVALCACTTAHLKNQARPEKHDTELTGR